MSFTKCFAIIVIQYKIDTALIDFVLSFKNYRLVFKIYLL